jgi:propionyl-CoA carboxylase alpha chain
MLLTPETRHKMGSQAISLARECGYYSTGTCEFLVDKNLGFYFLEMNTRLQVEHPITEEITGIDLVEQMIKIAAGQKLEYTQDDIKINGHSFEMRVYAEDSARKFLPSIGFLKNYHEPEKHEHIRIDTGVEEGSEISMYYDPMISKTITWGKTRTEALELMHTALSEYVIQGVTDNCGFGLSIIKNPDFIKGEYDTYFIPTFYPDGYHGEELTTESHYTIAVATACLKNIHVEQAATVGTNSQYLDSIYVTIEDKDYKVSIEESHNSYHVQVVGEDHVEIIDIDDFNFSNYSLIKMGYSRNDVPERHILQFYGVSNQLDYNWLFQGTKLKTRVYSERQYRYKQYMAPPVVVDHAKSVLSPMPGAIISVDVKPGDTVEDNQSLCTMEAMKMQNLIKSEMAGKVKSVNIKVGDSIAVDEVMIEFE